ncbi:MAG: ADP-glyceromanno-heptose 6-epimerase [Bdellovibrionota bacterium]|jgi:ADP-L-glycero-D-manno-heptose 6-epimerase
MYIITGGAGFIGSVFLGRLNAEGIEDILVVDNLSTSSKWKNLTNKFFLDYIHKDEFLDLIESDSIPGVSSPKDIQAIIHLGACSTTTEEDMDYLVYNNVRYSQALAAFALENKIRFIYASSAATYGAGERGYLDNEDAIRSLRPLNRYGYSKHIFDLWCQRNDFSKYFAGLKFFNVYGPNEYHKDGQFSGVYRSFLQTRESSTIKLFKSANSEYDDGEQKRDFVYVKDCADIILWLIRNPSVTGIYNVGSGKAKSWNDLARAVFSALGMAEKIEYIEMPDGLRKQYQYFTEANIDKLRAAGYSTPMTSLEDGVRDYVLNYLSNDFRYF